MKSLIAIILSFLGIMNLTFGQINHYEYGKLEQYEMRMTASPLDDEAPAVIIFDMGKTFFPRNADKFEVVHVKTTRIKIFSEEGKGFATVKVPLYSESKGKEKLRGIRANLWRLNGDLWKAVKLNIQDYELAEVNDNYSLASFTIPNVVEGDIIEYTYEISSPLFDPIRGWDFQNTIPTLLSTFEIRMIPFYEYTFLYQGKKPTVQNSYVDDKNEYEIGKSQNQQYGNIKYREKVYTFGVTNIPGTEENVTRIDFQLSNVIDLNGVGLPLTDTWNKVIKELLSNDQFGDFIDKSSKKSKDVLNYAQIHNMDDQDRLYSIVRLVKDQYKWNGVLGKYASKNFNSFLHSKSGNSGSINLFTVGLLRGAGINAFPVIMQSKNSNMVKTEYPFLHLYDYVLIAARIGGKTFLVDATESILPDNKIPMRCLNMKGLIVQKFKEEWITCTSDDDSYTNTSLKINFNENNQSIVAHLKTTASGYDGYILKDNLKNDKNKLLDYYTKKGYNVQESTLATGNFRMANNPYTITLDLTANLSNESQQIIIDPFLNEPLNGNPLKDKTRDYTTDFYYNLNKSYNSEIIIPDGYSIGELPEAFEIKNSMIEVGYKATIEGNKVIVDASYKLLKALYPPNEYEKLKNYFQEIVKRFNAPLVLVKTNQ